MSDVQWASTPGRHPTPSGPIWRLLLSLFVYITFIQTGLVQSENGSPKVTTVYVYNMSFFLVDCLYNRWQRGTCGRCIQNKVRGLTTTRSSKPPFPDITDVIPVEIEVSERCTMRQYSWKTLFPTWSDLIRDWGSPALCTAPVVLQGSLPRLVRCHWHRTTTMRSTMSGQKVLQGGGSAGWSSGHR